MKGRAAHVAGLRVAGLLAMALLLVGCGGELPELLSVEARVDLRPSSGGSYESLSVFASVRALDGIEDIESLSILCDTADLSWKVDASDWSLRKEGGDTWIGGTDLAMADFSPLPRGEYRCVVTNLAGQRVERSFRLDSPSTRAKPPALSVEGGIARIELSWPETYLLAYDGAGGLLAVKETKTPSTELKRLFGQAVDDKTRALAAYCYDPRQRIGAFSWRTTRK